MVYGAILSRGERFYTYLSRVFRAIGNRQTEYNWLITDWGPAGRAVLLDERR